MLEKSIAWRKEADEKRLADIQVRQKAIQKDDKKREDDMKKKEKMRKALIKAEHERRDEAKKKYLASLDLSQRRPRKEEAIEEARYCV